MQKDVKPVIVVLLLVKGKWKVKSHPTQVSCSTTLETQLYKQKSVSLWSTPEGAILCDVTETGPWCGFIFVAAVIFSFYKSV